jgi:DNA-binding response OmpR family regulator
MTNPNRVVLIIEDNTYVASTLERMARRAGFVVAVDPTGSSALQLARELRPAAVVLDLNLPERDGRDVLADLKRNAETHDIPVLMLSSNEDQISRLTCLKLGAQDYEPKPPSPVLFERLARQLFS